MEIFVGIITAVFAIGTIADKDKNGGKMLAGCFCVSMAVLAVIHIL